MYVVHPRSLSASLGSLAHPAQGRPNEHAVDTITAREEVLNPGDLFSLRRCIVAVRYAGRLRYTWICSLMWL